jgi:hypothetical protein
MIQLSRAVEEAWRTTVEQTAQLDARVEELARIRANIQLDAEMGDLALQMLERIMRGEFEECEPWIQDLDGNLRHDLGDVVLVYQPSTHQLTVETRLTEMISAEARVSAEASGFTVGQIAVEAVGNYYSDGWGGRTKERAMQEAQAKAERDLAEATEALHRAQHASELQAAEEQARGEAQRQAAEDLARRQTEMRAALRERLQVILANAEDRVYHTMNRLVGEAYRRSLIQLAQENGGRVLSDERSGSVINLELELF